MAAARRDSSALAALISACAVLVAGIIALALTEPGPLSLQMAQHIFAMNVLGPLVAAARPPRLRAGRVPAAWFAAGAQLLLLFAWHAPRLQQAAAESAGLHAAMLVALTGSAVLFWGAVLADAAAGRWRALAVLLLTGKLACLLGALLIFAPRDLYGLPGLALPFCATGPSTLADQQLAGLLMTTACPLSYLVAGMVLAARMLGRAEADPAAASP